MANNRYQPRYSNILDKDNTFTGTNTFSGSLVASGGITGDVTGAASTVTLADESADTTCFVAFFTAATGDLPVKTGTNLTFNASTGELGATILSDGTLSSTGGTITGGVSITSTDFVGNITGDVQGSVLTTEEGTGMAGLASYSSEVTKQGKIKTTHIFVDLEGIVSQSTANDIIGDDDAANAHIGQVTTADCGVVFSGSVTCLEVPTGGDNDIDFTSDASGTDAEDASGAGHTLLLNSGDWTAIGQTQALSTLPAANDYLYMLAATGDTAAAYTAGQFLIELIGYEA